MMYVSDPKNTDPTGYEPKPKKLEEVMSVPRGLKYIPPPKLFRSQYNQGWDSPLSLPSPSQGAVLTAAMRRTSRRPPMRCLRSM